MNMDDLHRIDELDQYALDCAVGGTDTRRLAKVSQMQAESASDDLEGAAATQDFARSLLRAFLW